MKCEQRKNEGEMINSKEKRKAAERSKHSRSSDTYVSNVRVKVEVEREQEENCSKNGKFTPTRVQFEIESDVHYLQTRHVTRSRDFSIVDVHIFVIISLESLLAADWVKVGRSGEEFTRKLTELWGSCETISRPIRGG